MDKPVSDLSTNPALRGRRLTPAVLQLEVHQLVGEKAAPFDLIGYRVDPNAQVTVGGGWAMGVGPGPVHSNMVQCAEGVPWIPHAGNLPGRCDIQLARGLTTAPGAHAKVNLIDGFSSVVLP